MQLRQNRRCFLDELVKKAYSGEVMLPDFQRNFVWSRQDVEELIKSLLENMFIGTFLVEDVNQENLPFKVIPIEGIRDVNQNFSENPNLLVLDGQQRLTSMCYALYEPNISLKNAVNPYRFFIDIEELLKDNIDDAVFSWSVRWREYKYLLDKNGNYDFGILKEEMILPLSLLKKDFTEIWYDELEKFNLNKDNSKKIYSYIKNILDYQVLTLEVSINEKPEKIAVLFEKINRTGVKLSIFDLLTARLYKFLNLREAWEKSFDKFENLKKIALNNKRDTTIPYYIIQSIALNSNLSIKARDMLKISEKELNLDKWNKYTNVFDKFLNRFLDKNEYGIADIEKWLPYKTILIAMLALENLENRDYEKINIWYWSSVFTERFSSSTETKLMKDYKELKKWFDDDVFIPEVVNEMRDILFKTFTILDKKNSGNAVYKGVFNLLFINDAKDFYENDKLKFSVNELEDHHIFPKKFLENKEVNLNRDIVANRTLITSITNKKISNKAPSTYVKEMIKIHKSEDKVKEILSKHFIDDEMFNILLNTTENLSNEQVEKNFIKFTIKRNSLIKDKIAELISY
jgi:hypothetical protein